MQLFYNPETSIFLIGEIDMSSGDIETIVTLPIIQGTVVATSYCPIGHIYFAAFGNAGIPGPLFRVDVVNKKVLSNVILEYVPISLQWDYNTAVLYEVTYEQNTLFSISYITGNVTSNALTTFDNAYGISALDVTQGIFYEICGSNVLVGVSVTNGDVLSTIPMIDNIVDIVLFSN